MRKSAGETQTQRKRAEQNLLVQLQVFCGTFGNTNELFIGMFIESLSVGE